MSDFDFGTMGSALKLTDCDVYVENTMHYVMTKRIP